MNVLKFGGSSLKDYNSMYRSAAIAKERCRPGDVVVVSALGGVTDNLIAIGNAAYDRREYSPLLEQGRTQHYNLITAAGIDPSVISDELQMLEKTLGKHDPNLKRWLDMIQSFGERASSKIFAEFLRKIMGMDAEAFFAGDVGYYVSGEHGNADPIPKIARDEMRKRFSGYNKIAVITGFVGIDLNGEVYTTGRGGSDLSAIQIANYLDAGVVELWSDVDGIKTANPKIVPNAITIDRMCFYEADQLAKHGAKLHPRSIEPAAQKNIPIYVFNTSNPNATKKGNFTLIDSQENQTASVVKGITMHPKYNDILVHIRVGRMSGGTGYLKLVGEMAESLDVGLLAGSETSIDFTVSEEEEEKLGGAESKLREIGEVRIEKGRKAIFAVGCGMRGAPGVSGRLFGALGKEEINIEAISQGNEINIGFVVNAKDAERAVNCIHDEFFG